MTFEMGKDWTDSLKKSLWEAGEELRKFYEAQEKELLKNKEPVIDDYITNKYGGDSREEDWTKKDHYEEGEVRVTDKETGAQKGSKLEQLGFVDPQALSVVGQVAGFGAKKYEKYNFLRGYDWSLSYNAMQRHLQAFWAGEDNDPESGLSHLGHAVWHGLALIAFQRLHPNKDDRPHKLT